jgi:hypothetical protein
VKLLINFDILELQGGSDLGRISELVFFDTFGKWRMRVYAGTTQTATLMGLDPLPSLYVPFNVQLGLCGVHVASATVMSRLMILCRP